MSKDEQWVDLKGIENISEKEKLKISNHGRVLNFRYEEPTFRTLTVVNGYPTLTMQHKKMPDKKRRTITRYVHKLVAEHFLDKPSDDHVYVIHLDYDKLNNKASNLRWATKREKEKHQQKSPYYKRVCSSKLSETDVIRLKKKLLDPNRKTRYKILAKQFGVSEMQLHRIKTGENWGDIKID